MILIPSRETKTINQNNRSKILGYLWSSFNIDLQSEVADIKVSPRLRINTSGVSNQGRMVAARAFDQRVFAVCGTRVFKNSAQNLIATFSEDASTDVQTDLSATQSDMEIFNGELFVSTIDALYSKTANSLGTGAWNSRGLLVASTAIHKLCYFQKFNRLYVLDGDNLIKSVSVTNGSFNALTITGDYTLSLNNNYGIFYTMAADTNDIWIGTLNTVPSNTLPVMEGAGILRWDGISSSVYQYKVRAGAVLAICRNPVDGLMYAVDSNAALLKFNGSGFQEIDRLPINKKNLKNAVTNGYGNFIHPNGMSFTRDGTLKILINNLVGDNDATIIENLASGIWEWDPKRGFVHTNTASLMTLASSTLTDHAQNRVSAVGALYEPNIYSESSDGKPTLICGIDYYSDASTAVSGIFVDDPLNSVQKYGYIVTPWIFSQGLKDTWKKVWLKIRQLLDSGDRVVLKYRTTETSPTEISITWVNTTSFTTATNVSALVGYEVEILQGTGGGKCAHITAVSGSGPYTVTLDETYTGVTTGTAKARVQNWKKSSSFTSQSNEDATFLIGDSSVRIQLKVCMQFTGDDEIFELALINEVKQPLV